ncbi:MAG: type II toxin-antitoxin system RelE/ParE family toxin [Chloroflexi bacterium]|nr:type II toxin-antitoxin system RelE/ParE family toxin [Chloroflexota bacterium]
MPEALQDINSILAWSEKEFGLEARLRYGHLIATAIDDVAEDPERLGSRPRPDLRTGVRTYHLISSRERGREMSGIIRQPRHVLVYRLRGATTLEILRVLHDAMDLDRHLPDDLPPGDDVESE